MSSLLNFKQTTERLLLRPLQDQDAAALLAICADSRTMRYGSSLPWTSIVKAEEKIARVRKGMLVGENLSVGLERLADGMMIGTADLFQIDLQSKRAEIGYCLHFDARGQGYMQETLRVLIAYGFRNWR